MNFLLLVFRILLTLCLDACYKHSRFSKLLLKEGFKFVLSRGDNTVALYLSLVLPPVEIDPVAEEEIRKKDVFMACITGHAKMIVTLSIEVVILYI